VQLYTKAVLKRLGWAAVITVVAVGVFLAAMAAGLPQMPTVGVILLAVLAVSLAMGRVFKATEAADAPDPQKRD
jgi:hypothetical protein